VVTAEGSAPAKSLSSCSRVGLAAVAAGERLPYSGLMWRFLWDFQQTVLRWARWAREEVAAWPEDLSQLDAAAEFARIVAAAGDAWPGPGGP